MKTFLMILLALTLPWAASGQDCIATLSGCDACVQPTGAITVSGCNNVATDCPGFPSHLLVVKPDVEPGSLHEILVNRLDERWSGISSVMLDPRRSYMRGSLIDLHTELTGTTGSSENWLAAAARRVYVEAAGCLRHTKAVKVPGRPDPVVLPRSSGPADGCDGYRRAWLVRQLGEFPAGALDPYLETGAALAAEPAEDVAALAAQLRDLGGGEAGALELLRSLELAVHDVGEDAEGGRK